MHTPAAPRTPPARLGRAAASSSRCSSTTGTSLSPAGRKGGERSFPKVQGVPQGAGSGGVRAQERQAGEAAAQAAVGFDSSEQLLPFVRTSGSCRTSFELQNASVPLCSGGQQRPTLSAPLRASPAAVPVRGTCWGAAPRRRVGVRDEIPRSQQRARTAQGGFSSHRQPTAGVLGTCGTGWG